MLRAGREIKAAFIEPMLVLRTEKLPEGPDVIYELKLDGYRALAINSGGKVHRGSRNDNDFNTRYPGRQSDGASGAYEDAMVFVHSVFYSPYRRHLRSCCRRGCKPECVRRTLCPIGKAGMPVKLDFVWQGR
jgi:hypothetical protein